MNENEFITVTEIIYDRKTGEVYRQFESFTEGPLESVIARLENDGYVEATEDNGDVNRYDYDGETLTIHTNAIIITLDGE